MRDVVRVYKNPIFVGELANAARDIIMRKTQTVNALALDRAIAAEAAKMATGTFAKVVRVAGRTALHTGPFPVEGYDVLETVFVSDADETGAVTTSRPAYHKKS